jgi:hypothetical protein
MAIIFAWLFINTWLGLIICQIDGQRIGGWDDLASLMLIAIISPWPLLIIRLFNRRKKRW